MKYAVLIILFAMAWTSNGLDCYNCVGVGADSSCEAGTDTTTMTCVTPLDTCYVLRTEVTDGDITAFLRSCTMASACSAADKCISEGGATVCGSCCTSNNCNTGNSATTLVLSGIVSLAMLFSVYFNM